jgi:hypothetical protein
MESHQSNKRRKHTENEQNEKKRQEENGDSEEDIIIESCNLSVLLGSLYGLNESQILLFSKILRYPSICIHYLEFMTDLKNNAIQKNLKVLLDKGLIMRDSVSLAEFKDRCMKAQPGRLRIPIDIKNERGYLFLYRAKPIEQLLSQFQEKLIDIETQIEEFKKIYREEEE